MPRITKALQKPMVSEAQRKARALFASRAKSGAFRRMRKGAARAFRRMSLPAWVKGTIGPGRKVLGFKRISTKHFRVVSTGTHGKTVNDIRIVLGGYRESFGEHISDSVSTAKALAKGPTAFGKKSNF